MKKLICIAMVCILLSSLPLTVYATNTLSVSHINGNPGELVYLSVELNDTVEGDSVGIQYSFDKALLDARPKHCRWEVNGSIRDFSKAEPMGVWGTSSPVKLQGTLCVLAFRIKENAVFLNTEIACTVTVKNAGQEVATYTATGTISTECTHRFESWEDAGELGHTRTCTVCQRKQTQSHSWEANNEGKHVFQCSVCGAAKEIEGLMPETPQIPTETVPKDPTEETRPEPERPTATEPTKPEPERPSATEPTKPIRPPVVGERPQDSDFPEPIPPTTAPAPESEQPQTGYKPGETKPTTEAKEPAYRDYNNPPKETVPENTHSHDHESVQVVNPSQSENTESATQPHIHEDGKTHEEQIAENRKDRILLLTLAGVVAIFVLALCLTVAHMGKKKRSKRMHQ